MLLQELVKGLVSERVGDLMFGFETGSAPCMRRYLVGITDGALGRCQRVDGGA